MHSFGVGHTVHSYLSILLGLHLFVFTENVMHCTAYLAFVYGEQMVE